MITANSRYRTAVLQTVDGPDGATRQEMRVPFPRSRQIAFTYHQVRADERIDTIAHDYFGDGRLWWIIADANPEILDWMALESGDEIRVPNA